MTLTDFLLARIAEDEAVAQKIADALAADPGAFASIVHDHPELAAGDCAGYLADYDPARALAECEAKRRIVGWHYTSDDVWETGTCGTCGSFFPCPDLRNLAAVYADHPDYRPKWKP